nr:PREDICTED: mucin-2-like [Pundamilia nyererei]
MTLYDTLNKIPLFSAAKYRGDGGKRPMPDWKIEPQEKNKNENINCNNQARDQDYRNNQSFDRGHLFPSSYGSDQIEKMSTFTLTNIVPQQHKFNTGRWNRMEKCVKCVLNKFCINNNEEIEGFIVIGALPSNSSLNNRINIPSVLWSAFCCFSKSQNSWLASAHWGENVAEGPEYLQTQKLTELHRTLGTEAFPGTQCPLDTTVTHFYSDLNPTCNCPPTMLSTSAPPTSTGTPSVSFSTTTSNSPRPSSTTSFYSTATFVPITTDKSTSSSIPMVSVSSSGTTSDPPSTMPVTNSGAPSTTHYTTGTNTGPPSTRSSNPSGLPSTTHPTTDITSGPPSTMLSTTSAKLTITLEPPLAL